MIESPHVSLVNDIAKEIKESAEEDEARALDLINPRDVRNYGKIVCVGRTYAEHAAELGNSVPTRPVLFMKPASSVIKANRPIASQVTDALGGATYDVHYEAELCLLIGRDLKNASAQEAQDTPGLIDAVTVGLDLTLRDLQNELKANGHPWERAKGFAGSCVIGKWMHSTKFKDFSQTKFQFLINDEVVQDGDTSMMHTPIYQLLSDISHAFGLEKGDVVMTGTPKGVGVLKAGDKLTFRIGGHEWTTNAK